MKNILIMLGLCMMMLGCGKDKEEKCPNIEVKLSDETSIGANTMSCKIDGKVWAISVPNENEICVGGYDFINQQTHIDIVITGQTFIKCAPQIASITLEIDTAIYTFHNGVKRFKLGKVGKSGVNMAYVSYTDNAKKIFFYLTYPKFNEGKDDGWVEITRMSDDIVSGRFECVVYLGAQYDNVDYSVPLRITEGRFDWHHSVRLPCR